MVNQERRLVVDINRYHAGAVVCGQVVAAQQEVLEGYEGQSYIREMGVFGILRLLEGEDLPDGINTRITKLVIEAYATGRVEGQLEEQGEAVFQMPLAKISQKGES